MGYERGSEESVREESDENVTRDETDKSDEGQGAGVTRKKTSEERQRRERRGRRRTSRRSGRSTVTRQKTMKKNEKQCFIHFVRGLTVT